MRGKIIPNVTTFFLFWRFTLRNYKKGHKKSGAIKFLSHFLKLSSVQLTTIIFLILLLWMRCLP